MTLAKLLTYFHMKNMVQFDVAISEGIRLIETDSYEIRMMRVNKDKDKYKHAIIIYRKIGERISLINADIFYTELGDTIPGRVYATGACLTKLEAELTNIQACL